MSDFKSISINNQVYSVRDELARETKADLDIIAEEYDQYSTYNTGDSVIYKGKLYTCKNNNVSGDWDLNDWDNTIVKQLFDDLENRLETSLSSKIDGAYVEDGVAHFTADGEELFTITGIGGGGSGGGGGANNATLTLTNNSGWLSKTISDTEHCVLSLSWSSEEDGLETGSGILTIRVNGTTKLSRNVDQGAITVDIASLLTVGANTVRVSISDVYNNIRTLVFNVSVVTFSLTSSFDDSIAYNGSVLFPYVATGAATKTMQFILDGVLIASLNVTTSGRQQNFTIPAQSHGSHTFEVYFTADINGVTVSSNHLYHDIIFVEDNVNTPIIAVSSNITSVNQFYSASIPYIIYTPNALESEVTLSINENVVQTLTVDRTKQIWVFRADTVGSNVLEIASGGVSKTIDLTVIPSDVDVEAETTALDLFLSPVGRSNSETNPNTWVSGETEVVFSDFNNTSDGWVLDDNGNTVLRLSGNARIEIPFNIFEEDARSTGKTIEFDFATRDVLDYESIIISCLQGGKGFTFTSQKAILTSEQSTMEVQYKEDEHVRVSFVIEKRSEHRLIYAYINGIISSIIQYPNNDNFQQTNPVGISIGSNDSTVDLYGIRVYSNSLTRYQILDNWIADTADGYTMLTRYNHNNVYDEYGNIVINHLPNDLPYLVLEGPVLPQYKGDKRTIEGYYVDPLQPSKSFSFTNAQIDVQGTSSQYYARKNYKIKFKSGFSMTSSGEATSKYQLRNDSIPTNTFCFKADVASSEGANNVELARLYNDICPYDTPPQQANGSIRQGIDGFPIVIFWSNGINTTFLGKYNFNNDKGTAEVFGFDTGDESWEILNNTSNRVIWKSADYSGTDWLTDFEARYPDTDPAYTDSTQLAAMASWLVATDRDAATNYELPESVTYDGVTYVRDNAAYRLAKFKNEIGTYWELDDLIFNYVFTELFLMVDSRAKNVFPTKYSSGKWCILPYDYDTALGINNEGALVFTYSLEDTDRTGSGADVYNGQQSVLWNNLRDAFSDEIRTMYSTLRSNGLNYLDVEDRFESHQNVWPEAIFNEDAYFKYVQPLIENNEGVYLSMAQGSKATQRQWWLYNRFRYLDSKYKTGDAQSNYINLRAYEVADITLTFASDCYGRVKWGSYETMARLGKDDTHTFVCGLDTLNDTETMIYSADYVSDVGDLSPLKVGYANFAAASRLRSIKIGDDSTHEEEVEVEVEVEVDGEMQTQTQTQTVQVPYENGNLTELYLGNNTMLQKLDVTNCSNLTMAVDVSGCRNIEELYFGGTSITGLQLPNGGVITTLVLPSTVTNLIIRNQPYITTFTMPSYSNISTLWLENVSTTIDEVAILNAMTAGSRVRLIGVNWTLNNYAALTALMNKISTMIGLDENGNNVPTAQVSGDVTLSSITTVQLEEAEELYPYLNIHYTTITGPTVIRESWETVISNINNNNYSQYEVGSVLKLDLGELGLWHMQLVAKDTDILADGTGTAATTWLSYNIMNKYRGDAPYVGKNWGGASGTSGYVIRNGLRTEILPQFPQLVQDAIKPVSKTYRKVTGTSSATAVYTTETITDTIWIPSAYELNDTSGATEESGVRYTYLTKANRKRVHKSPASDSTNFYGIRTASNPTWGRMVSSAGDILAGNMNNASGYNKGGTVFGFCI